MIKGEKKMERWKVERERTETKKRHKMEGRKR
jgi:hypothetical protein